MTTNWKQLLEKRRDNFGQEKAEAYTEKALANIVAAYAEAGHASIEPLLLGAIEALAKIKMSDENLERLDKVDCWTRKMLLMHISLLASDALAEIKKELEEK